MAMDMSDATGSMHSWLWMNRDLSDVLLSITCKPESFHYTRTSPASCSNDIQGDCETLVVQSSLCAGDASSSNYSTAPQSNFCTAFNLHSQVICSSSLYFRARLTTAVGLAAVGSKRRFCACDSGVVHLDEPLSPEDASAASAVLHYFYTSQLTLPGQECAAPAPEMLLQMLQVADRWQAPHALATIVAELCNLGTDTFPTLAAYSLPAGLQSSHALTPVMVLAERFLLLQFSDATTIARCPVHLQRFCTLPFPAVLAILNSNQLTSDAEATVLVLLHHWREGPVGTTAGHEEVGQLSGAIRYSRLSGSFFTELMQRLSVPLPTCEQLLELCRFRGLTPKQQRYPRTLKQQSGPSGWYLPERKSLVSGNGSSSTASDLTLQLSIPFINLLQILSEVQTFLSTQPQQTATKLPKTAANQTASGGSRFPTLSSKRLYASGLWWMLQLSCSDDDTLWCGVVAEGAASLDGSRSGEIMTHGVSCDVKIGIHRIPGSRHPLQLFQEEELLVSSCGCGVNLVPSVERGPGDPLDPTWWEQFSSRGEVHLVARITNIDSCQS